MRTTQGAEISLTRASHIPVGVPVRVVFGLHYTPRVSGRRWVKATIIRIAHE